MTIIAPRHPERGPGIAEIATTARACGRRCARAGELPERSGSTIADTLGELGLIYRLAPIVFMGGSLVRHGGQNPIEAVRLGAAVSTGRMWGISPRSTPRSMPRVAPNRRRRRKRSRAWPGSWLADPAARQAAADAAAATVKKLGGALERTCAALDPYLMQLRLEDNVDAGRPA